MGALNDEVLRLKIGEGLTGWVAEHNQTIRLGDAGADPRGLQLGTDDVAESMLLVPMSYESRVLGVIVVSKVGYDQFGEDDQRTLEIFAGYAAQAVVNAEGLGQAQGGIDGDSALAAHDLADPGLGESGGLGEAVLGDAQWL